MGRLYKTRKLILNLHLVLGLGVGLVLMVLAITGSIMAFEGEIDAALNPSLYHVVPTGPLLSLADLAAKANQALHGDVVGLISISRDPNTAYGLVLKDRTRGSINQYSGAILGLRTAPAFVTVVHKIHLSLMAGEIGEQVVSCCAVALLLLVLSGLYLWWPLKRLRVGPLGSRRFYFDLHNSIGFGASLFLLVFAVSGAFIGFEEVTVPLVYKLTRTQPISQPAIPPARRARPLISADAAVESARGTVPGAVPVSVIFANSVMPYRVAMRFPEDRTPGGRTHVWIDPHAGNPLAVENSRTAPLGTRLINWNRAAHTGDWFGYPTRILGVLVCLALVVQVCTGPYLWWTGRRRRADSLRAAAPARVEQGVP